MVTLALVTSFAFPQVVEPATLKGSAAILVTPAPNAHGGIGGLQVIVAAQPMRVPAPSDLNLKVILVPVDVIVPNPPRFPVYIPINGDAVVGPS